MLTRPRPLALTLALWPALAHANSMGGSAELAVLLLCGVPSAVILLGLLIAAIVLRVKHKKAPGFAVAAVALSILALVAQPAFAFFAGGGGDLAGVMALLSLPLLVLAIPIFVLVRGLR